MATKKAKTETGEKVPKPRNALTKARKTTNKVSKPRAVKKDSSVIPAELDALKKQLEEVSKKYGELLSQSANELIRKDKMLGQILLGLYAVGIGPDMVLKKCHEMFKPVIPSKQ